MGRLLRIAAVAAAACSVLAVTQESSSSAPRPLRYVALGDSFSSGEGVPPFRQGTNRYLPPRNICHRSYQAYPALVAGRRSSPGIWGFWACSGARLRDMTSVNRDYPGEIAQLDRVALPGESDPGVDLVTLTIGGNDAQFAAVSLACVSAHIVATLGGCRRTWRAAVEASIERLRAGLPSLYRTLRARAPRARIIVLGYPNPFPAALPPLSRCRRWFSAADLRWLHRTTERLNDVILAATMSSHADVSYVPPSGFGGHDICSPKPWFSGIVLLPSRIRYTFHPNGLGQRRLAKLVLAAL
jgi:lysophospholipase L1-like esterase